MLLRRPPVSKAILTLDALKIGIDGFEFLTNITHVGIDRIVGHQGLHGRIH